MQTTLGGADEPGKRWLMMEFTELILSRIAVPSSHLKLEFYSTQGPFTNPPQCFGPVERTFVQRWSSETSWSNKQQEFFYRRTG